MFNFLYSVWSGFGAETKASVIGAISTIIVGGFGFGSLLLQISSQGKQSRDAVAENERRRLKAGMYEDAVIICREVADKSIEFSNSLRSMMYQVEYAAWAKANNRAYSPPSADLADISNKSSEFTDSIIRLMFLVEKRMIIDPRLKVFCTAMSVVMHDLRSVNNFDFLNLIMNSIPFPTRDGEMLPYEPPSVDVALHLREKCEKLIKINTDAMLYTEDLIVELQNHMLGDLFGNKVIHRKPLDPSMIVITLDRSDELEKWFESSTDWGKEGAKLEKEMSAAYRNPIV